MHLERDSMEAGNRRRSLVANSVDATLFLRTLAVTGGNLSAALGRVISCVQERLKEEEGAEMEDSDVHVMLNVLCDSIPDLGSREAERIRDVAQGVFWVDHFENMFGEPLERVMQGLAISYLARDFEDREAAENEFHTVVHPHVRRIRSKILEVIAERIDGEARARLAQWTYDAVDQFYQTMHSFGENPQAFLEFVFTAIEGYFADNDIKILRNSHTRANFKHKLHNVLEPHGRLLLKNMHEYHGILPRCDYENPNDMLDAVADIWIEHKLQSQN